jgi:uncharacterized caspase-like protein
LLLNFDALKFLNQVDTMRFGNKFMRFARCVAISTWSMAVVLIGLVPAKAEKRVALIVGNGAYQYAGRLANPRNDAALMAVTLKSLGFTLIGDRPQIDLDKAGFDNAIQSFGAQLQNADVGLFLYSGHGLQSRGENYLIPISADLVVESDVDSQLIDVSIVLQQMKHARSTLNIVILDACRSDPFEGRSFRAAKPGLAQIEAPENTFVSYATQPGNIALDGNQGNSPYTQALAQIIRQPGLDLFEVFNQVGLAVRRTTKNRQAPWVSTSPIKGQFYFAGEKRP